MSFPKDFVWGAAAASFQIEGGAYDDGKGLSVWDMMCRQPGKVYGGHTGDVACDHYHRYVEDVGIMADIGLQAYRLSVSWPRVLPMGVGAVNEPGLDFYDRLVDELLAKNVEPWVTLFHWDYPYELFLRGGWLNPNSSDWFAEYTSVLIDKLSDRISHWFTLNEPPCFIGVGHSTGTHAPGLKLGTAEVLRAAHNALLAHGKAVQTIRARAKTTPLIGYAPCGNASVPASDDPRDVEATRQRVFSVPNKNLFNYAWFADPIYLGQYPEDGVEMFGSDMCPVGSNDMDTICQPLDFAGLNCYASTITRAGKDGGFEDVPFPADHPRTAMGWVSVPETLYWIPKFLYERYGKPIVITESGMANCDWVNTDGKVDDPQRIDYIKSHLRAFGRAIDDGVEGHGFFQWSIMDNFEWVFGLDKRFGLVHIDYETQKRTPKSSAYWYKDVIVSNGAKLDE